MNYKTVLNEKVKEISTDKDFLFTVSKLVKTDEEAKSILDYIEQNNEDLFENVLSLVFEICENRKKYKS
ncbi:hypothetical protein [uncultured Eubacterium sp.]|uniref:hypothetical protein n=1 Tax=uncultured Eubacterium sp. TaxID=165185 RepID=UPI002804D175|nr:hypothetical protein [uncultured Eubacterium sp.]